MGTNRALRALVGAVLGATLMGGCASGIGGDDPPGTAGPSRAADDGTPTDDATAAATAETNDPRELLGTWRVTDAAGEGSDTWIQLDPASFRLWRDCDGEIEGAWMAAGTVFVSPGATSTTDDCSDAFTELDWLTRAQTYQAARDGWRLLDGSDQPLATLVRDDDVPTEVADAEPFDLGGLTLAEYGDFVFAEPAPLPAGLEPATRESVVGRWVPVESVERAPGTDDQPHVEVAADGTYRGTDGCNGGGGAWAMEDGGHWVPSSSGNSTQIGCDNVSVPEWFLFAVRAGFEGETLVLLDREGERLGELRRG